MQIQGLEMFNASRIPDIYSGDIEHRKLYIENLEKAGYLFAANNNTRLSLAAKWKPYSIKKVASSAKQNPRFLWAIKPLEQNQ